jgi:hypothetical protein
MKKIKIKKRNGVPREKSIRIKNKRIADSQAANYLFFEEEFITGFPVDSFFKSFDRKNNLQHKRN